MERLETREMPAVFASLPLPAFVMPPLQGSAIVAPSHPAGEVLSSSPVRISPVAGRPITIAPAPAAAPAPAPALAAAAQSDNRVRWEYRNDRGAGYFEKIPGGMWIERQPGGGVCYFRETARTSDFIEIYDPSRGQVWVRMYANQSYWKHPTLTGGEWRTLWGGSWIGSGSTPSVPSTPSNPQDASRVKWEYRNDRGTGYFEMTSAGNWIERMPGGGVCYFKETGRTTDYIEIYDSSRGQVWVRMYASQSYWKHPLLTGGQWNTLWTGSWTVTQPDPGRGIGNPEPPATLSAAWVASQLRGRYDGHLNGTAYDYTRSTYVNAHIPIVMTIDTAYRRGDTLTFDITGRFGTFDRNTNQWAKVGGVILNYTYKGTFTVDLAATRSSGQLKGWWNFDATQYQSGKVQARMYANGLGVTLSGGKVLAGEATVALSTYVNGKTTFNSTGLKFMVQKTLNYN
jgi:hypothetical protein